MLFAFSTICTAQKRLVINDPISAGGFNAASVLACQTNLALGQPANGTIRTIEAVTQGYRNTDGKCVFDVKLHVPANLEQYLGDAIKWEIDGNAVPGSHRQISVSVPYQNVTVHVTYTIGNQQGTATRTF